MNCIDIEGQMDAMVDGALDQRTEHKVRAHLSCCPTCQSKWEQLQGLRALLQSVAISAPSESLERRVMSAFYKKHASKSPVKAGSRALWLPLSIPQPAFAMIVLAVMMAALMGAFVLGRVTATRIVLPAPPTLTASSPSAPPSTPPESGGERQKKEQFRTGSGSGRYRRSVHRAENIESVAQTSTPNPFENFTTVSAGATNYSTRASLDGFEPLKDTKIRVVKGDEQR